MRARFLILFLLLPLGAQAQDMPGMDHGAMDQGAASHDMANMPGMEHMDHGGTNMAGMDMGGGMLKSALGGASMMREASGTSWQPDSTPMEGLNLSLGDWQAMLHGNVTGVWDGQTGPRGDTQIFSQSMAMGMAQHEAGPGTLTLRGMISLDPLMGRRGYPLLLQTGESADGVTHLVDRQHPHDLVMELSGTYAVDVAPGSSAFLYVGYPGEPALGPPTFMHRFSGAANPAAPLSHHGLDSTHITFGVVTGGVVLGDWKIEASAFHGREPDQYRFDFESFTLDSASARISFNPSENWSLQASHGFLKSPEQLAPAESQHRTTLSAIYNRPFGGGNWQTTLAFGRNSGAEALDAVLLESAVTLGPHTFFGRAENADKNELFEAPDRLAGRVFNVTALSLGYVYDIALTEHLALGVGAMGTVNLLPSAIQPAYGSNPTSTMLFTRLKIK